MTARDLRRDCAGPAVTPAASRPQAARSSACASARVPIPAIRATRRCPGFAARVTSRSPIPRRRAGAHGHMGWSPTLALTFVRLGRADLTQQTRWIVSQEGSNGLVSPDSCVRRVLLRRRAGARRAGAGVARGQPSTPRAGCADRQCRHIGGRCGQRPGRRPASCNDFTPVSSRASDCQTSRCTET